MSECSWVLRHLEAYARERSVRVSLSTQFGPDAERVSSEAKAEDLRHSRIEDHSRIEEHLEGCLACTHAFEQEQGFVEALRGGLSLDRLLGADFSARVAAAARSPRGPVVTRPPRSRLSRVSLVAATLLGVAIGSFVYFLSVDRALQTDSREVAMIGSSRGAGSPSYRGSGSPRHSNSSRQGSSLDGSVDRALGSDSDREAGSTPGTHSGVVAEEALSLEGGLAAPTDSGQPDDSSRRLAELNRRFAHTDWLDFDDADLDFLFSAVQAESMSIRKSAMMNLQPYDGPRAEELGEILIAQIPKETGELVLREMFRSKALRAVKEIPASLWNFVRTAESGRVQSNGVALFSERNEPGSKKLFRDILKNRPTGGAARYLVILLLDRTVVLGDDELIEDVSILIENASESIVRMNAIHALVRQLSATRAISALQDYCQELSVADDLLIVLWRERNLRYRAAGSEVAEFFARELDRRSETSACRRVLRVLAHFSGVCKDLVIRGRLQRIPASQLEGENLFWWLACRSHTDVDESGRATSVRMRNALRSVLEGESEVALELALAAVAASSSSGGPQGVALFELVERLGGEANVFGTAVQVARIRALSRFRGPELHERSDSRIKAAWNHSDWWARLTATLMGLENRLPGARECLGEVIRAADCPVDDLRGRVKWRSLGLATDGLNDLRSGRAVLSDDDLRVLVSIVHAFE